MQVGASGGRGTTSVICEGERHEDLNLQLSAFPKLVFQLDGQPRELPAEEFAAIAMTGATGAAAAAAARPAMAAKTAGEVAARPTRRTARPPTSAGAPLRRRP